VSARDRVEAAERRIDNERTNNPNRGRAGLERARLKLPSLTPNAARPFNLLPGWRALLALLFSLFWGRRARTLARNHGAALCWPRLHAPRNLDLAFPVPASAQLAIGFCAAGRSCR
jgi:hypothetical protein